MSYLLVSVWRVAPANQTARRGLLIVHAVCISCEPHSACNVEAGTRGLDNSHMLDTWLSRTSRTKGRKHTTLMHTCFHPGAESNPQLYVYTPTGPRHSAAPIDAPAPLLQKKTSPRSGVALSLAAARCVPPPSSAARRWAAASVTDLLL